MPSLRVAATLSRSPRCHSRLPHRCSKSPRRHPTPPPAHSARSSGSASPQELRQPRIEPQAPQIGPWFMARMLHAVAPGHHAARLDPRPRRSSGDLELGLRHHDSSLDSWRGCSTTSLQDTVLPLQVTGTPPRSPPAGFSARWSDSAPRRSSGDLQDLRAFFPVNGSGQG